MTHNPHPTYRPDIDGLRAIAVLSVVAFHKDSHLVQGGFVGVDIFFVISGYLISSIIFKSIQRGTFSFSDFYIRRVKRILPALILVLISIWTLAYYDFVPTDLKILGKHIAAAAIFVSNFVLWQESGYFDTASSFKPLLHLWSLGIEEQFYLFWPPLIFFAWKCRVNLFALTIFITLISFSLNILWVEDSPVATFYLPLSRFWELLIGSTLAYAQLSKTHEGQYALRAKMLFVSSSPQLNNVKSALGLLMLISAIIGLDKEKTFPGWWALLPTMGTFLLISAGNGTWINRNILSNRPMVFVGLISYPLYLWHWPLLTYSRYPYDHAIVFNTNFAILWAFLLAWLTYRFVERPIRFGSKLKIKGHTKNLGTDSNLNPSSEFRESVRSHIPHFLVITFLSLAFVGIATYRTDGFKSRYPEYIVQVLEYDSTMKLSEWRVGECFLLYGSQNEKNFGANCIDPDFKQKSNSIFLWGDSIAASLYPGFKHIQSEKHFSFAQYTATNCPPFLNYDDPNNKYCREINESVVKKIVELKPHAVVLSAHWLKFHRANAAQAETKLRETVAFLNKLGIKKIIFIGPLPLWNPTLPRIVYQNWKATHIYPPPAIMLSGTDKETIELDRILQGTSLELGMTYVSAYQLLCDGNGCLTRVGGESEDITSFDTMHMTIRGAQFLIKKMFDSYELSIGSQ